MPGDGSSRQIEFDFTRARQLAAIRSAILPKVSIGSRNVSGSTMKAVLMAIDSRAGKCGECWASAATLATDCGLSLRTVERALVGLRNLSLIVERRVRRGRSWCKNRRICFANLLDFEATGTDESPPFTPTRGRSENSTAEPVHTDPGSIHTDQGARSHRPGRPFTPTRGRSKRTEGQIEESIEAATAAPNGFLEMSGRERAVDVEALIDATFLDEVHRQAVAAGSLPDSDAARMAVFGFGVRCRRHRAKLRNPVGFFFHGVRKGLEWLLAQVDDEHDRERGRKLINALRAESDGLPTERSSDLVDELGLYQSERDFDQERDRQRAALAAEFGGIE